MEYTDWYYEKTKKGKKIVDERQSGYRKWKDLATGRPYCISDEEYDGVYQAGTRKLEQLLKENNLKEMERLFYGTGGTEDVELFPDLPYFIGSIRQCVRLRDYVCIRTACLYALQYHMIKEASDLEREKDKIRMQGFTWKLVEHTEANPELEALDQMLNMNEGAQLCGSIQRADFVKGGTIKIKQYYLETNKIPEIRGASLLLDRVNDEKSRELICKEHIRECLVYAGGGKIMGIFPEGTGDDICRKMGQLIEKETVTAQYNFCSRSYEIQRLACDYAKVVDEMDLLLEEQQGLRWDFRMEPQADQVITEEILKKEGWHTIEETAAEYCTSCRNRRAVIAVRRDGEEEKLCPSCLCKRRAGGREAKRSRHEAYQKFVMEKCKKEIVDDKQYNNLKDISKNGFIGIIYGDANNMSSHINNLRSLMMMRCFSEVIAATVTEIVYAALYANLQDKLSFEIIAVGGDDIFLIVPGDRAYDIACMIGNEFDKRLKNPCDEKDSITMSVGVCVTHHNMPVQYSFAGAQKLLKSAKEKAWTEREKGTAAGTIDWMVIENEMPGTADLKYQRKDEDGKAKKTLRPYTWEQAKAVKKFIQQIKNEKTFALQLRQSWHRHTKEEAELFYEYQMNRKTETRVGSALHQLAGAFGGEAVKNNIQCQDAAYAPWEDVIELWDYVGDRK